MAVEVARAVLALTVRLVDRLAVDPGARSARTRAVRVDVIDLDEQTGVGHVDTARGIEAMLGGDAVEPDGRISGTNLAVDRGAVLRDLNAAGLEPERAHEEIVGSRDVATREHGDRSSERWHALLRPCGRTTPDAL
jgi:hypothetical protein